MLDIARWKIYGILSIIIAAVIIVLPNALPKTALEALPGFLPKQQINLGLDLRGGSHVVFKVDIDSVISEKLEGLLDDMRTKLRAARIGYTDLRRDGTSVRVRIIEQAQIDEASRIVRDIIGDGASLLGGADSPYALDVENQTLTVGFTEPGRLELAQDAVVRSIEIIRRRLDEFGTTEPLIQAQGGDRVIVQLPGVSDPKALIDKIGQTAKMTFHLVNLTGLSDALGGRVPPGEQILYEENPDGQKTPYLLKKRAVVTGENLIDAQGRLNPQTGENVVSFTFDNEGARKFGDVTRDNVGKPFAIVLDGKVISAPVIREPILTGSGQISGGGMGFTSQEAADLAILLRAGALPAKLTVIEQRTVGAELGNDSIRAGIIATIIGSLAVVGFIALAYNLFGLFANIAVVINVILILAVVSLFQATLTLPGIAGIVLTVGMAVDSNVLIYERIKEELKAGKTAINALDAGFSRSLATILDANLTTLIAALILFQLGAGPVRGFAVTQTVGTLTTIFTAFTVTRTMVALWVRWKRPKRIPIDPRPREDGRRPWFRLLPEGLTIPFMKYRHIGAGVSIGGAIVSLVLFSTMGLNYGIDFKGGSLIELATEGPADLAKIRSIAGGLGLGSVQVQAFGEPDQVLVRVEAQPGGDEAQQAALTKVKTALEDGLGQGARVERTEVVGPTVGGELVQKGILALLIAIAMIMVYVWFRFEWQFSIGAVLSLFHDIFLTIGVFALFRIEFGLSIIAALLTIVGYSMNDTVVICDRIRENLRKYKKMELRELIDQSLNETLSRTVMTSVTTLLALFSLYIFGGAVIRNFTFAMIWGVFIGTYSSIYIAAPFILLTGVKRDWSGVDTKPAAMRAR